MKKIITGILAGLMLLLSGCGAEKNGLTSGFQPDFTVSYYNDSSMVATEDGYFVDIFDTVYYIDAETMEAAVFCADPACGHGDGSGCLALRVGERALGAIQYYNGEIYFKDFDYNDYIIDTLHSVKTDATDLRDIQQLFNQKTDRWPENSGGSNFKYSFAILGDYIMFCPRSFIVKVGKLGEPVEDAKELFTYDSVETWINGREAHWDIWVDGGYFYYCGLNYPDGSKTGRAAQLLYRYDPVTEENTLAWRCDEHSAAYWTNGWYLRDGIFYYYINERQYEDAEPGLYRCALKTMETVKLSDCAFFNSEAEFDSQYAYIMEHDSSQAIDPVPAGCTYNAITVLSLETGEEIARLDLDAGVEASGFTIFKEHTTSFRSYGIVGADETWLFVQCGIQEGQGGRALYAIEKERFAENAWQLIVANVHY